jgi:HEAT repeat protein/cyclophilin family peptidyl-prolyl cis-trans isomerase
MRQELKRAVRGIAGQRPIAGIALALVASAVAASAAPVRAQDLAAAARGIAGAAVSIEVAAIRDREGKRDTTGLADAALRASSPLARAAAARALGRIQNRGSVPALTVALRDRIPSVRREAAFALGLVGDSTAAAALEARLGPETDPAARVSLVTAIGYLGARRSGPALARAIRSPRAAERWAAALAAARARDSTLVPPLTAAAKDARPDMRWRVAYALGRIGDRRGAVPLRALAGDPVEIVRYHAARALGDVGDSASAPRLVALLHDPSWRVRVNAAHALGAIAAARESRSLRPLLGDPNAHVRWEAALSLGALRDSGAVPLLTTALGDSATGVVQAAAIALLQIRGEAAIPTIAPALDLLPAFLRSGLIDALGDRSGPASLEILLARVRDDSDPAQAAGAASALGRRKADRAAALPVLRERLAARDFTIVCSAADALGALGDTASVPALKSLLGRTGGPDAADIRSAARGALAALGQRPDSSAADAPPTLRVEPIPGRPAASATVRTERGTIRIALDAVSAPRTVENFARLARSGYFNGLAYHRVVPNFVVQDGCPRGDGWGSPGYSIPCEYNDKPYGVGTVGMALSGKDTGGSQWFITLSPQPRLEGRYTVFGEVVLGMDVVERLQPGDRIVSIEIR